MVGLKLSINHRPIGVLQTREVAVHCHVRIHTIIDASPRLRYLAPHYTGPRLHLSAVAHGSQFPSLPTPNKANLDLRAVESRAVLRRELCTVKLSRHGRRHEGLGRL